MACDSAALTYAFFFVTNFGFIPAVFESSTVVIACDSADNSASIDRTGGVDTVEAAVSRIANNTRRDIAVGRENIVFAEAVREISSVTLAGKNAGVAVAILGVVTSQSDVAVFDGQIIDITSIIRITIQITEQSDVISTITVNVQSRDIMVITVKMPDGLLGRGPCLRGGGRA